MANIEIKVPALPESVADAAVVTVAFSEGAAVNKGDILFELETDKVMLEVTALESGAVSKILVKEGDVVVSEQLLAEVEAGAAGKAAPTEEVSTQTDEPSTSASGSEEDVSIAPAARRMLHEHQLTPADITVRAEVGRITPEDIQNKLASKTGVATAPEANAPAVSQGSRHEERVPMTRLRKTVANRLLESQANAAILSTFNEVDMSRVMHMRKQYKEDFESAHGVKLGLSCFFVKAVVAALKEFPDVNASIDGDDVVYHNYMDIGVAIGSDRGLVVPVIRNAEHLSMADIEKHIKDFAKRAQTGKIGLDELTGGTFSITNGGVFGSMLSTPIINPPQSAILGMHNITKRAIVVNDEVVVRPVMYLALSYDHRLIDGSTSVRFLVHIKNALENPERLLLDL